MNTIENIILGEFPKAALDQAASAARIKPSSFLAHRLDLRGKTILAFTDSPEMPAERAYSLHRNGSGWVLGVHVADVGEYVCEGSPLDAEARRRRATVRSGFSTSNMLPDRMVYDICNLASAGDKLAISVLLELDESGSLLDVKFEESVIRIADACIYSEVEQILTASDASSVAFLRDKYAPYRNILEDLYELAARCCVSRRNRGGLDCTYFSRVYGRDNQGKITSYTRVEEADTRAMIREIGYFIADAVGKYMLKNKIPCVYNGRGSVSETTLDYLSEILKPERKGGTTAECTAIIADMAKGTPYYGFVCETLAMNLPHSTYSTSPSFNSLCGSDTIVNFFSPVSKYTDLLVQNIMKTVIKAKSPKNLNLNRQKKFVEAVAKDANAAEEFIHNMRSAFITESALELLANCSEQSFPGYPVYTQEDGSILVMMSCGIKALIPAENAVGFKYSTAQPKLFKVITLGNEHNLTTVYPID